MPNDLRRYIGPIIIVLLFVLNLFPKLIFPLIVIGIIFIFSKYLTTNTLNVMPPSSTAQAVLSKIRFGFRAIVFTVLVVFLLANMIVIIPAGSTGVYHLFGKVRDAELSSGIHLINPLAGIIKMSIRTQQYTMSSVADEGVRHGDDSIETLTKEGLKVLLDITILYRLNEDKASDVYRTLGVDYEQNIIRPEVRSVIRQVVANYEAKDIYSEKRDVVVGEIEKRLRENIEMRGITVESTLLRNVVLPPELASAIEQKLTAEQESERYDFVLQKETKEAERKRIEAEGQRDSQRIISTSLSNEYLQYLFIKDIKDRQGTIYVPTNLPLMKGI
jgi:regulator of protease activity HflC (stomatin/prohibitin superfamily)